MLVEIDFFVHKFLLIQFLLILLGMNFLTHKSPILLLSMIDLQRKKFFYEDVLCRVSPGCCSRGSPTWWLERKVSLYL